MNLRPLRRRLIAAALLAGLAAQAHAETQAQSFVSPMCRSYVSGVGLRFDTAEHARWYKRFWTGQCDHLFACLPGKPNWNEITSQIVGRGRPTQFATLQAKACTLGERIGLEWSREHDVRRITTTDLRNYGAIVKQDSDPLHGLEIVERSVDAALRRAAPPLGR